MQQAVELYTGPFLSGFFLEDCASFEEWSLLTRERLQMKLLNTLQRLSRYFEQQGDYEPALDYARRWVEVDALQEEAQRQLMRLLALSGQRSAALVQFESYRQLLADELGVAPNPDTVALHRQIQSGQLGPEAVEPVPRVSATRSVSPALLPRPLPPRPSLPFVARDRQLAQLDKLLSQTLAGQGGVVFITGNAGSGKTTLIQAFAQRAQQSQPELIVAGGYCNAYTGLGDPYLPFRQILRLLTADFEVM